MLQELIITISGAGKAFVELMAYEDGIEPQEIVRKALSTYHYFRKVRDCDGKLVILRADGTHEQIGI